MIGSSPYSSSPYAQEDDTVAMLRQLLAGKNGEVSEEDIAALLGSSHMDEQMQMAEALRGTPMPEGRQVGRVYQASNPLEVIAAAGQRWKGDRDSDELIKKSRLAAQRFLANYIREPSTPEAQQPQPQQPLGLNPWEA